MKKSILFLLIILGFYCCTPPKYIAKKQSDILNLNLDNSLINYIIITDNDLKASKILDSTYFLIINKRYSKLINYIKFLEKSGVKSSDLYLSKSLLLITKKEYINALKSVKLINDSDYMLLKRILTIDLDYEISKLNGGYDYSYYLKKYQDLIDSFPNDFTLKKIVAIRLRYLRYNY